MKITAFILLVGCLQVSAIGYTQKVSLSYKNASLETIFNALEKQTNYVFFLEYGVLQKAKKVSIDVKDVPFTDALTACLRDQELTYSLVKNTVIIEPAKKKVAAVVSETPALNPIDIRGRIVNDRGEPVVATITVKGTKVGVTSNEKGEFVIPGVDGSAVLVISGVGIENMEVRVDGRTFVTIAAKVTMKALDEVQMIAYGSTSKRLNTGNVTSVKSTDIEKQPVNNPLLALQGRVAGLFITQSTGLPGSGVTVMIQGRNSINNGNDPLYIIDGVPYTSQLLPTRQQILGSSGTANGSPFSFINPADIERVDVLKGADATAIYGSRAANGAILITTKKGIIGKTKIDINFRSGFGKITQRSQLLNTRQYLDMRYEALKNDGTATIPSTSYDLTIWDTTQFTDWQKELIGGTSKFVDAQVSASGGNERIQCLIGAGYHKETTVFPGDFSDQKGSFHINVNNASLDKKFRMQFSASYVHDYNQLPGVDLTRTAITLPPNAPSLYKDDGSLNWAPPTPGALGTWVNPLSYLLQKYKGRTNNLISNLVMAYQLTKDIQFVNSVGYTNMQVDESKITPLVSNDPGYWLMYGNTLRSTLYADNNISSWIIEPQAIFKKKIGKGKAEILLGATFQKNKSSGEGLNGNSYNNDFVLEDIKSAASITAAYTVNSVYKYNALFGRINYNWQDKYLINLTARRDGSSRFGPESQFHNFGSIGLGWIFSNEGIIKNNLPFISFAKIRTSYGTSGSDQIGDYKFMDLYNSTSVGVPYQGSTGLFSNNLFNPNLEWEETKKFEVGFDLGFLNDRVLVNTNFYLNQTSNQLISYFLPSTTGFNSVNANLNATVENTGWEIQLNTIIIRSKELSWTNSINFTLPKNRLKSFQDFENSSYSNLYVIGEPISVARAYRFLGVDPLSGRYQVLDRDGNATFQPNPSRDNNVLVNFAPKYFGGFQNAISYKSFQLSFLFQFVKQIGLNYLFGSFPGTASRINQPISVLNRWQKQGDITSVQKYSSNNSISNEYRNAINSDAAYSDATFLRLKNISFTWQFPKRWIQSMRAQNVELFIQGQNLLTFSRYKDFDPETRLSTTTSIPLPPLKVLTIGGHINF